MLITWDACSKRVGQYPFLNKQIVPAQQYLGHHIAFVTEVFDGLLNTQIIEAESLVYPEIRGIAKGQFTVPVDHAKTIFFKFKGDFTDRFQGILLLLRKKRFDQG